MKTNTMKFLGTLFVLSLFTLAGCKKAEAGATGPAGPTGPQGPVVNMISAGNITGTVTGSRRDNVAFSETFNYTYVFPGNHGEGTLDSISSNNYRFSFQRQTNDIWGNDFAYFIITTTSKTATTGSLTINFSLEKPLGNNKWFQYSANTVGSGGVTSLSYNTTTGVLTGNFNLALTSFDNNTGKPGTFFGSFQANISPLVYKPQQASTTKID